VKKVIVQEFFRRLICHRMKLSGLKPGVSIRLSAESLRSGKPLSATLASAATSAFILGLKPEVFREGG
jgi:hypothetical protein